MMQCQHAAEYYTCDQTYIDIRFLLTVWQVVIERETILTGSAGLSRH